MIFFTDDKRPLRDNCVIDTLITQILKSDGLNTFVATCDAMEELAGKANLLADEKHHKRFRRHNIRGYFVQSETVKHIEVELVLTTRDTGAV